MLRAVRDRGAWWAEAGAGGHKRLLRDWPSGPQDRAWWLGCVALAHGHVHPSPAHVPGGRRGTDEGTDVALGELSQQKTHQ